MTPALVLALAFLLGSLPFSLWAGKMGGVDLRRQGSGILGATNVYRVLGWRPGLTVLLLDIAKGSLGVLIARALAPDGWEGALPALAGVAGVAGHVWSPFVGFRGGKGVATGLGTFLALAPAAGLVALAVWIAAVLLGGWISVASALGALSLPVTVWITRLELGARAPWALGIALMLLALVVLRHRSNWERLRRGEEQPIWEKNPETPAGITPGEEKP
jgi:glycerol-3-phosphate acyltransferase PlsY